MSRGQPEEDPQGVSPKFRKLADLFLTRSQRSNRPETYRYQQTFLQSFCDSVKTRRVMDLKGLHVSKWLLAHPQWGQSTRAMAIQIVKACLNWGVQEGFIHHSPLAKVRREAFVRRERILTADEKKRISAFVGPHFRDFLFALEQTGMRPFSEAGAMTAQMVDFAAESVTFQKHKTANKGKKRVVYLPPELLLTLRKLALKYPDGPLFRTRTGKPWNRHNAWKWMDRIDKELGIAGVTPYAWRHTYITDSLACGIGVEVVAELVGNTPRTIYQYYAHLDQRKDALREAARRAVG
jgi:integrase